MSVLCTGTVALMLPGSNCEQARLGRAMQLMSSHCYAKPSKTGPRMTRARKSPNVRYTPQDLLGSMYALLGIDPDGPLPNPRGMDFKVMPQDDESAGRLTEIT